MIKGAPNRESWELFNGFLLLPRAVLFVQELYDVDPDIRDLIDRARVSLPECDADVESFSNDINEAGLESLIVKKTLEKYGYKKPFTFKDMETEVKKLVKEMRYREARNAIEKYIHGDLMSHEVEEESKVYLRYIKLLSKSYETSTLAF